MPIEERKPTVESLGTNIFLVDPNPPGMTMHPPEDMFIYVKFSARNRDRTTFVGNDISGNAKFVDTGTIGEIDFIATNIRHDDEGNIITDNKGKQQTYATSNYTNIGGIKESDSRGILEGFGIKSIDIKYNASLVPQVNITFIDVRGAGLFDVISEDNRRSPYSIFFKLPYPVFTLSVKGYFGKTVDYCLHMTDWNSNFDGSTGNFEIQANFVGFQQAFLADMVLGNVIGAVNTKTGYNKLMEVYNDEQNKNANLQPIGQNVDFETARDSKELNIRKLDDFFLKISKLQIEAEAIKEQSDSFNELKVLNTQLSKLKRIQTFIGRPIPKEDSDSDVEYSLKSNDPTVDITAPITDNFLTPRRNYLSIRDYIVYNTINVENIKEYFVTLNNLTNDYNRFINNADSEGDINKNDDATLINTFKISDNSSGKEYYTFFTENGTDAQPLSIRLDDVFDRFIDQEDTLYLGNSPTEGTENNVNSSFKPSNYFNASGRTEYEEADGLSLESFVSIVDFRNIRTETQKRIDDIEVLLKEKRKGVQEELNEVLNKKLEFNPNIRNVFRVLANNIQAMLSTLYDVSSKAESQSGRKSALGGYNTDVPANSERIYPWPSIYRKTDGGADEEIYIGEINNGGLNRLFPEYEFVEEVFDVLVSRTREFEQITKATSLKDGLDNDNWFPINPIDYNVNPFLNINVLNTEEDIRKELIRQLVTRNVLLTNYSKFDNKSGTANISTYGEFDGINANRTIFSNVVRSIITTNFKSLSPQNIIDEAIKYGFITPNGSNNILNEEMNPEVSGVRISGKRSDEVDYILIGNDGIINNSKKLWSDIENKNSYSKIYEDTREFSIESAPYFNNFYINNNYTSNLYYNVWLDSVNRNLIKENTEYNKYLIDGIELIDPIVGEEGKYINVLNPNKSSTNETNFEQYITDSLLFNGQVTDYSKALLLLSSLPFNVFETSVLRTLRKNDEYFGSRIVKLPKYYLYYIGGLLYRQSGGFNIDFSVGDSKYVELSSPSNSYITNLGSNSGRDQTAIEESLTNLPEQTKNKLINQFKVWVDSGKFDKFRENIVIYKSNNSSNFDENAKNTAINKILGELKVESSVILFSPEIFNKDGLKNGLILEENKFSDYYRSFIRQFEETDEDNNKGKTTNSEEDLRKTNGSENKIKLEIYNYFKNINDKWVGSEKDGKIFNACGTPGNNLIDYFKFIDRGWSDIGDRAVINLNSLLTIGDNLNTNMYFFIAKILRDSNFLFQILPSYVNFKDPTEVSEMFMPIPNVSERNRSSGPVYTCIYVGGASKALDIGESNDYYWSNDGFSFRNGQIPDDINSERDFGLVAFRVAFGAENQTIFKNVALNQQEHKETAEYFRSLSDLVDKRGGTQKSYQGTDLLRIFKTRSYTCKVDALGCMNIQPLMYFDLQNVPFFNGAYLITSVSHNITPNHMTTNFTGVRQSKFITSYVEDVGVFLDIDLNEVTDETVVEFENLENTDPIFKIGLPSESSNEPFNQDLLTLETLQQIGIKDGTITEQDVDVFKLIMEDNGIISNTQVTMFLSNIMANSDYLENREETWGVSSNDPIEEYIVKFPKESEFSGQTKYYNPDFFTGENKVEFVNSGVSSDIVYNPPGTGLQNSFKNNGNLGETLGNSQIGDAYRYRQRGYLYVNGKKQYNNYFSGNTPVFITKPDTITENKKNPFTVAALVWVKRVDENGLSSNEYTSQGEDPGTSSVFARTITLCQPYNRNLQKSFEAFRTVLSTFNLLDDNKP
jgi:predicted chitinase